MMDFQAFRRHSLKTRILVVTLGLVVAAVWSLSFYASRLLREGIVHLLGELAPLQLELQLQEKKVEAHFTPELKAWLAEKGFDPQMGARPMARLIQETIRKALADELLFGRLVNGGEVTISIGEHGKAVLTFPEKAPATV